VEDSLLHWRRSVIVSISCVLHLAVVAGILLAAQRLPARLPVLPVQFVTLETAAPEPPAPTTLPKPISRFFPRFRRAQEPAHQTPAPASPAVQEEPTPARAASQAPSASLTAPSEADGIASTQRAATTAATVSPPAVSAPLATASRTEAPTELARPKGGYQVRPSYPSTARRLGAQGTTLLKVHVLADGRVGEVVVQESAGHSDLDRAAADAVRQWRFDPARRGSEAVAMWVLLPVEFRLR
jgi:protein TonB